MSATADTATAVPAEGGGYLSGLFRAEGRHLSRGGVLLLMAPFFVLLVAAFLWPLVNLLSISFLEPHPTLEHYERVVSNPVYARVLWRTFAIALTVTALCLALAFPVALLMARSRGPMAIFITACVVLPFWSSVLVRTAAWAVLLQRHGLINEGLQAVGVTSEPIQLLYTRGAVVVAMAHVLLPFMVLPIYGALRNIPQDLSRAAAILGAGPLKTFREVILPLALPGVISGTLLVFLTALGYFITPALLGSPQEMMIATLISQQIREMLDWPFAAALVGVLTLFVTAITLIFSRVMRFDRLMGGGA
ncbi:ABC transporter permease [Acuticoccus sediminis]|uniref:ABC transporter permease n=2 Tax=Acuticoccus sediminis TaxID=2184697 RepID=A0A8B2NRX3_9HYPH|nr:ABC transporter permease [Acuticoccus sediminis]